MPIAHDIVWDEATIARLWDHHAAISTRYFSDRHGEQILLRSGIPLNQSLEVLDFGCGPGFMWRHLRALGARWRYTGLDVSEASVAELVVRAKNQPLFAGAYQLGALPGCLPASTFDLVLLIEVIEHLDDARLDTTLREVARLLRPGGKLLVTTPNSEDLVASTKFCPECGARFHEWQHVRSWTADALAENLARYGLRTDSVCLTNLTVKGIPRRAKDRLRRAWHGLPAPHLMALFELGGEADGA